MSEKYALVVDDTPANLDFIRRLMTQAGFQTHAASNAREAMGLVKRLPDLNIALIDMELPDGNGLFLTRHLRDLYPDAYLVVATVHDQRSIIQNVFVSGGNCFLVKPHGFMELFKRLMSTELAALRRGLPLIIDQYGPRDYTSAVSS